MNPERYARIKDTFARARELAGDGRRAYLDEICAGDDELRVEVEELLEADLEHVGDAFDRALSSDEAFDTNLGTPRQIGKYRIRSVCGSGGMGTVFEAEQVSPRRRVALKVIQSLAPRPDLLRRFRRETEILARLQHPGIAQIFDAGEFEQDGGTRPYFAMEFVDGAPLLDFAAGLAVAAQLELFTLICDAVHYAHQQGVVHRDLKPDNIFVVESSSATPDALGAHPKILDFGVARLTAPEAQMTMATGSGQLLGSIPYMSPEQASGASEDIDERSDVYGLGVILFELLTGELPHATKHRAIADALHAIRFDEPIRLGHVDPELRGDLETIVGKCLQKDKDQRYESVKALADDVRRHRALEPITARPPSTWYQLKKFTQRNRTLVGGVTATAIAIIVGAVLAVLFAVKATRHADAAREAQARSDRSAYRANLSAASALLESDPVYARRILESIPEKLRGWEWRLLSATLPAALLEFGAVTRRTPPWPHEPESRFHNVPDEDMQLLSGGDEVVALSRDDEFSVWRTRTGELLRTLAAPGAVDVFAAARDGSLLAAALKGGRVIVCDPRDETPAWTTWFESEMRIDALAVAPEGDRIAIDRQNEIRWGARDGWRVIATGPRTYSTPPGLEFSSDGARLARQYRNVRLFEVASGEPIGAPMDGRQGNWAFALSPDMRRVAVGQMRRELKIFDSSTGAMEFELLGHSWEINHVAWGSANRLLSTSRRGGTIRVWDVERREQIAIFDAPNTTRAEFLDDDHILSLSDGRFRLWTLRDRRSRELNGHAAHVFGTVFSGDGDLLATSAPWGDLIVWDALEGSPLYRTRADLRDHFAFDRSGELLLHDFDAGGHPRIGRPWYGGSKVSYTPTREAVQHTWQIRSGTPHAHGVPLATGLGELHAFRNHHGPRDERSFIDGIELAHAPATPDLGPHPQLLLGPRAFHGAIAELIVFDGPLSDSDARAIDSYLAARRRNQREEMPNAGRVLAFFRADERSVHRSETGRVQRWCATNDPSLVLEARGGPQSIQLVDGTADRPTYVLFGLGINNWLEMAFPQAKSAESITVCWLGGFGIQTAPPNDRSWTAYSIETIDMWSDRDERAAKAGAGNARSDDGRFEAQVLPPPQSGGSVVVRDVLTGHCAAYFEAGDYHYLGTSFHPDSRRLACGGDDGTIDVFDVETQALVRRIEAHTSHCYDVAFSPDGRILASGGNDNALRLWDTETYELLLELPGHQSYVRCLNWSPDGSQLVSGSGDYRVRIWDATPRSERYAQLLERRALESSVSAAVRELHAAAEGDRDATARAIRRSFDADLRLAALRVLAKIP